jgi:hypothetical protein
MCTVELRSSRYVRSLADKGFTHRSHTKERNMNTNNQLVSKVEHVVKNAKQYWKDLEDPEYGLSLQKLMPRIHHWYVHEDKDGIWFVPSKFGGYRDMTASVYLAKYNDEKVNGGLHGKETETQLKQISRVLDETDETNERYTDELANQLWRFGQRRRKGSTISILSAKTLSTP